VTPEFKPVATRRTFEEAVEQVAERITLGELRPGDQLPSERLLAHQMQISRPTVREAIKVLADSGVLEVRTGARGGAFVTSEFVPREVVRRQSDLRYAEVGGVLEARRLLEPQVAQLAAVAARDSDFEVMSRTIDRQRRLAEEADGALLEHEDQFLSLDLQFHLGIARATGNSTIVSLVRSLMRRLEIARDMALHEPPVFDWSIDIHERTLAAIRSRDPAAIDTVMDEHLAQLEEVWEREGGRPLARLTNGKVS
jgi:GntR family transcriptional repressor for pyruvate dehydrogenase complex